MEAYQIFQRDAATGQVLILAELMCEFDFEAATLARKYRRGTEIEVRQGQRIVHRLPSQPQPQPDLQ